MKGIKLFDSVTLLDDLPKENLWFTGFAERSDNAFAARSN